MLNSLHRLQGEKIRATDGELGSLVQVFFDDQAWAIRYLVVDTGRWLPGREVLISPYAITPPFVAGMDEGRERLGANGGIDVALTREQVRHSPDVDTHQPVSRRHERDLLSYYAYPDYWEGGGLWAWGGYPLVLAAPPALPASTPEEIAARRRESDVAALDVHLRSSAEVTGYDIQASDDSIGHVEDFLFDDTSFAIRYLVVDTRNWWPGGRRVLLATHWIDRIEWESRSVHVTLTRAQVRSSPPWDLDKALDRDAERHLHEAYGRSGYWERGD